MRSEQLEEMMGSLKAELSKRQQHGVLWRGELSSSAVSTAVAMFALYKVDSAGYADLISRAAHWLRTTMNPEGAWGDTVESRPNLTATLLSYAALSAADEAPEETKRYLTARFGGYTDRHIIQGVLAYYGKDLTFSVPILVMCALAGVISDWKNIPQLPFELSVLPQRFFKFLQLPVVSYAIPALIAVGILRYCKSKKDILSPLRERFIAPSLKVLTRLQPSNGGFLEAPPLTAFVTMCMTEAGYGDHITTRRCVEFLKKSVRPDGAWPIDSDLATWVTTLSIKALGDELPLESQQALAEKLKESAFRERHHFTASIGGGWGWTDLPGAAPDADDTSGALVALHSLLKGEFCGTVKKGLEWLLALQNSDGGMPTFCKGWGKLPFDRSSPDITAHALLAYNLWMEHLPEELKGRVAQSAARMINWLTQAQDHDGSWTPLWFGDQDAENERAPVYATAVALESLAETNHTTVSRLIDKGVAYLLEAQNSDGGWGGAKGVASKVTMTARAVAALTSLPGTDGLAIERGVEYLWKSYQLGHLLRHEPIGLYFARLWYSEQMYNITFTLNALKKYKTNKL